MRMSTGYGRKSIQVANPLNRNLGLYALAAASAGVSVLALVTPAGAQIVYTPFHKVILNNEKILIDLNHDRVPDLAIREVPSTFFGATFPGNSLRVEPGPGGGLKQGLTLRGASAMSIGQEIGPREGFFFGPAWMCAVTNYGIYYEGSWVDVYPPHYLGIRFLINGETHYGWARLTTIDGPGFIEANLSGYAYETQANKPIRAGDTGSKEESGSVGAISSAPQPEAKLPASLGALALGYRSKQRSE